MLTAPATPCIRKASVSAVMAFAMAAGIVILSPLVSAELSRKSLYASRKLNNPVVTTPGHMTGMMTRRNAWNRVQPSTRAASSSSLGILTKKERNIQIVKGWLIATSTMSSGNSG